MRIRIKKKVLEQEWKSVIYSLVEKVDWGSFRQTKQNKQIKKRKTNRKPGGEDSRSERDLWVGQKDLKSCDQWMLV